MLTCGPPSLSTTTPKAKGEDGESCSDDDNSEDEENQTVSALMIDSFYCKCLTIYIFFYSYIMIWQRVGLVLETILLR